MAKFEFTIEANGISSTVYVEANSYEEAQQQIINNNWQNVTFDVNPPPWPEIVSD